MATATLTRSEQKTLAVVNRHAETRTSIKLALVKALLGLWGGFDHYESRLMLQGQAARSAVLVDQALAKTRRLSRSYAKTMLRTVDALPAKELDPVQDIYPRSGTDTTTVYTRGGDAFLYALKQGKTRAEARAIALQRIQDQANTDVMLAERDEMQRTFRQAPKVIGHRRIIHPELSKSGFSCGLCVVASTRFYKTSELLPMHGHCNCTDAPITEGFDPGLRLNDSDLQTIYDAAGGSTYRDSLKDVRVRQDEHGELGPVLTRVGQSFRTVDDANKSSTRHHYTEFEERTLSDQRKSWQDMVKRSERAVQLLKLAQDIDADSVDIGPDGGTPFTVSDFTTAIKFHQGLIDRYRDALAASR